MDCLRAQELLLAMDDPEAVGAMDAELRTHVESWRGMRSAGGPCGRMEMLARGLPVPVQASGRAGGDARPPKAVAGKCAGVPIGSSLLRRSAAAAGLLLVVGLVLSALLLNSRPAAASPELVGQLVDWNLEWCSAEPAAAVKLYREKAGHFEEGLSRKDFSGGGNGAGQGVAGAGEMAGGEQRSVGGGGAFPA